LIFIIYALFLLPPFFAAATPASISLMRRHYFRRFRFATLL